MDKQLNIILTVSDAELIMGALIKLPYEKVASLISVFDQQVRSQIEGHE